MVFLSLRFTWQSLLWQRFKYLFWFKGIACAAVMHGFFALYLNLLKNPSYSVTEIPYGWLDQKIGFSIGFFWVYVSLWFYVFLPLAFLHGWSEIRALILGQGGLCLTGLFIFYRWPTSINVTSLIPTNIENSAYDMLRAIDAAGNTCPSLHVATSVYAAIWLYGLFQKIAAPKLLHILSVLWCVLIVYSTLAIKQHVLLDVFGGVVLACVFAWIATMPNRIADALKDKETVL